MLAVEFSEEEADDPKWQMKAQKVFEVGKRCISIYICTRCCCSCTCCWLTGVTINNKLLSSSHFHAFGHSLYGQEQPSTLYTSCAHMQIQPQNLEKSSNMKHSSIDNAIFWFFHFINHKNWVEKHEESFEIRGSFGPHFAGCAHFLLWGDTSIGMRDDQCTHTGKISLSTIAPSILVQGCICLKVVVVIYIC